MWQVPGGRMQEPIRDENEILCDGDVGYWMEYASPHENIPHPKGCGACLGYPFETQAEETKMMRLCYIDGPWAYFTDQPLKGDGRQWGDDWNDAPYEHNAGTPYDHDGQQVQRVAWSGPFETPADIAGGNSNYSVEDINAGAAAWLITERWSRQDKTIIIPAGTPMDDFIDMLWEGGGEVYRRIV